jgi:hypothetical protein
MTKFISLLFATAALAATSANAANTVATLSFTGATLVDGGTMSGKLTYTFDAATSSLISLQSARVTTNGGGAFPAVSWIYNVPGQTDNVDDINLQDGVSNSHQFGLRQFNGVFGRQLYLPFSGIGTSATLIIENSSFGSNLFCMGVSDCTDTKLLSTGTSTGVLGTGAVPEPASWAMLIAGFGLTGAAARRRRAVAVAA